MGRVNTVDSPSPLQRIISRHTITRVAAVCNVTRQAVAKWRERGLPPTEWTGDTDYAQRIEQALGKRGDARKLLDWSLEVRAARRDEAEATA